MGFFSVAAPIVGSIIGSKLTNSAAKSAANNANAFTEQQLKNRHQWEVADLKKAGLNPILSAVPARAGILIHPGNSVYDTKGCILPGLDVDDTIGLKSSRPAINRLYDLLPSTTTLLVKDV